jgi:hypothetical protein
VFYVCLLLCVKVKENWPSVAARESTTHEDHLVPIKNSTAIVKSREIN